MADEPFPQENSRTPTDMGQMVYTISDLAGVVANVTMRILYEILDQNGLLMQAKDKNLINHLTAQQTNQLQTFITNHRADWPTDLGWDAGHQVGRQLVFLYDLNTTETRSIANMKIMYRVTELDNVGQFIQNWPVGEPGDMTPFLSANEINLAQQFMVGIAARGYAEIIA